VFLRADKTSKHKGRKQEQARNKSSSESSEEDSDKGQYKHAKKERSDDRLERKVRSASSESFDRGLKGKPDVKKEHHERLTDFDRKGTGEQMRKVDHAHEYFSRHGSESSEYTKRNNSKDLSGRHQESSNRHANRKDFEGDVDYRHKERIRDSIPDAIKIERKEGSRDRRENWDGSRARKERREGSRERKDEKRERREGSRDRREGKRERWEGSQERSRSRDEYTSNSMIRSKKHIKEESEESSRSPRARDEHRPKDKDGRRRRSPSNGSPAKRRR